MLYMGQMSQKKRGGGGVGRGIKNFEPSRKRENFFYGKQPGHFLKDPFSPDIWLSSTK